MIMGCYSTDDESDNDWPTHLHLAGYDCAVGWTDVLLAPRHADLL